MLKRTSKKRDEKARAEQEAALKKSLAEKVQRFQPTEKPDKYGYTELTINGERKRVMRERITIPAISPITEEKSD